MRNRFNTIHIVFSFLGSLFIALSIVLIIPLIIVFYYGEIYQGYRTFIAFLLPSISSFLTGIILRMLFHQGNPKSHHAILICSLAWISCSAMGAIPFVIGINSSYINGYFECISGFTTTGITMFTGLDGMPKSILFWRSLTQWVGGLGIITFFLAVIFRGSGAHRLFGAESHKIEMKRPVPSLTNTVKILFGIYVGFTLFIIISLIFAGMSPFDSICHSFTVLSTGGFSPHDASIEYYRLSAHPHFIWIEYILIIGMLMGGMNFLIHYRVLSLDWRALFDNTEIRYWWGLISLFFMIIFIERIVRVEPLYGISFSSSQFWIQLEENLRIVLFQVTSIITTTGFGTRDIGSQFFGNVARQLFLIMMVIGGCVGSTGGGFKVLRVSILAKLIKREIMHLRAPQRSISRVIIDGDPVETNEVYRVSGLFFMWIILLIIGGCITAILSHYDGYSSFSGMFSALGNIGPCYIPVKDMGHLHPVIKLTYIFGMIAGRLEILPVLLIFSPKAWRS